MDVGSAATIRTLVGVWYEDQAEVGITVGATSSDIPEPSTAALLALGAAGLAALRARRRTAA
ncbi:MAG: PEP-CTERM sorting domain-containing protein [Bryobacterales bacterium]|nr:PEP-CTERM sorting domain-containing protein [Bryobacterales bacterium]